MSDSTMFWFHCGRCGSLFEAHAGHGNDRICTTCGAAPNPGLAELQAAVSASAADGSPHHADPVSREKQSTRKRKPNYFMFKLATGWALLMALIIIGARTLFPSDEEASRPEQAAVSEEASVSSAEDAALHHNAGPQCIQAFKDFLAIEVPEALAQFVFSPAFTAARMARFFSLNPMPDIDPESVSIHDSGILDLPGGKAFEAYWTTSDGKILETVFRQENDEWRLDWENYARYSDHPWPVFLAGSGPDEGEFRLLARERLAAERKHEDTISLVLYEPRFGNPREAGFQSPEFLVSRNTRDGKLLDAAFKLVRGGGRVFGSKLASLDPEDMIRVRVKVRRTGTGDEQKYEITEVKACHWFSLDEPGVEPEPSAPEETQEPR